MPLAERQRLLRAYRAAVQAYHEASADFDESTFHDSLHRTERARNHAESARAALLKHEHLQVEPNSSGSQAHRIVIIGSTVALFNVDTEQWELFELAVCGPPPEGALACVLLPGNAPGQWIVDAQDLSDREKQQGKLYFTEAGLAILREAGLEM